MMRHWGIILMMALMLGGVSSAQPPPPPDAPRPVGRHPERRREEIRERVQTMKIWKLTDELQLSDDQAAKFFPLMNKIDGQMEDLEKARRKAIRDLGDLVWDSSADPAAIKKSLEELDRLDEQQLKIKKDLQREAGGILKPDQLGKLILFNMRFPGVVRDVLREVEEPEPPPGPPPHQRSEW